MTSHLTTAWLHSADGREIPIEGTCSLGRSSSCHVVVPDERASRRHAFIHCQGDDEYWLVDQGSSNGTYVNDKRVHQPTQLADGDRISIVGASFYFRHPQASGRTRLTEHADQTVIQVRAQPCWLVLADIVGSSELSQRLPAEQLALMVGSWLSGCAQLVEGSGGAVNKYLGDGFFAYWRDTPGLGPKVFDVVRRMMTAPDTQVPVRYVLHVGDVTLGGAPTMGEESLSGPHVNFLFRLEKIAGGLRRPFLCSEAASQRLAGTVLHEIGRHPVPGFSGEHKLFALEP